MGVPESHYQRLGGEQKVRELVDHFYDLMDLEADYALIRQLHAPDLSHARDKLFWFLSGWLGGPQLYVERFGHPRLRGRHMPFSIGEIERDQWMGCMVQAMEETAVNSSLREELRAAFFKTADFMRNKEG